MKHWTKKEIDSAKLTIAMSHKMGRKTVLSKPIIVRPHKMTGREIATLTKLITKYGQHR